MRAVKGKVFKSLATRIALFSYAAWVSFDFHMVVTQTFNHVVKGEPQDTDEVATKVARAPLM
ncbi:hypothetical protein [Halodesulfovibrio sp.]|uniref:hypothetical protein n=1 Tax=Halodesulfovibrio sp. TaxID=1912772 RepID=UPI0025D58D65|nr:hypothetical protein [Halodesulfovibrio sp.]MCT4534785.1 hypothetical protein [Halodesulfovibrio sp.]